MADFTPKLGLPKRLTLSVDYVRSVLSYDPETGVFVWLKDSGRNKTAGKRAGTFRADDGYRHISVKNIVILEHILAWFLMTGEWPSKTVDHRNLVRDDNSWSNLRLAEPWQQNANTKTRSDNSTGVKGVSHSFGAYEVSVKAKGTRYRVRVSSLSKAKKIREDVASSIHGEFYREG